MLPLLRATRYVIPLREGGSLPAVLDTETDGAYVVKFRGAGQGAKVLVAEIIAGRLAQVFGLPVPDLAAVYLDEAFGRTERDPEIQDILKGSRGLNVGLRFMEGALNFNDVADAALVDPDFAADVVVFDAFVTNIDRTARNPNLMIWNEAVWLIDHGATLYFHHNWPGVTPERAAAPFAPIKDHVLLPFAGDLKEAGDRLQQRLGDEALRLVLADIPDDLLMDAPDGQRPAFGTPEANREAYFDFLSRRLAHAETIVNAAAEAKRAGSPDQPLRYRR
ncbi:MAG: HipA family kinase [Bacteroidota bacterium]